MNIPQTGNLYIASNAQVEALPAIQQIGRQVYGGMPFQAGPCCGHNKGLNGIEYHSGSEVAGCIRPCALFLGHIWDMEGNTYDGTHARAGNVPGLLGLMRSLR